MPYIKSEERPPIKEAVRDLARAVHNEGQLNYAITLLCHEYALQHGVCYNTFKDVLGTLDCAAKEFYRVVVGPYERTKRRENGAVSELEISNE